ASIHPGAARPAVYRRACCGYPAGMARAFAVIYSHSVPEALRFYTNLGFEETYRLPPDGEPGYVSLRRDTSELGIVDAGWPRDQLGVNMGAEPRFEIFV